MFVHYRTKGFVFKKTDRREADQLFSVYSRDYGRLEVVGRGIRKVSSKLRPGIEIFYLSEIEFIQGKGYKTLTDAIALEKFSTLRKNLEKLDIASEISKVLDSLIKGQEQDSNVWNLLLEVFAKLDDNDFSNTAVVYPYFLWRFLSFLGYRPDLHRCCACQDKFKPDKLYFSPKSDGIMCSRCFSKEGILVEPGTIKIIRFITGKDFKKAFKLKISGREMENLEDFSKHYLSYVLESSGQV